MKKRYITVLFLAIIPLWTNTIYAADLNLRDFWTLDEKGDAIAHDSVGTHDGVVSGAEWTPDSQFGGALNFKGSDYVNIGNIGMTGDWTVCFWAKSNGNTATVYYPIGLSSPRSGVVMGGTAASVIQHICVYDGANVLKSLTAIVTGVWYHIAITKNATAYSIYVNGVCEQTGTLNDIDLTNFKIGVRSDMFGYFKGIIDDVGVWDRALDAGDMINPDPNTINYARLHGISSLAFDSAYDPHPSDMQAEVAVDTSLCWGVTANAAKLNGLRLYFSDNFNEVNEAIIAGVDLTEPNYTPGTLNFNTTYYWRVDEVNGSSTWRGPVWEFKTIPDPYWDPNLCAHWTFDESSGTTAQDSAGSHNGIVRGGAQWTTGGRFGGALQFDGYNDYVDVGNLGIAGNWTVCFWAKNNNLSANAYYAVGLSFPYNGIAVGGVIAAIRQHIGLFDGTFGLKTDTTVQVNVWHHVAVVKNGATYSIYVDGVCENTYTGSLQSITLTSFKIGTRSNLFGYFNGLIDDVGVWNRAMELGDIENPNPHSINYIRINGISDLRKGIARNPSVLPGQTDVSIHSTLGWRPGGGASGVTGHDVYFGTNLNVVKGGLAVLTGDIDGDVQIAMSDLSAMANQWLNTSAYPSLTADLDHNDTVDFADYSIMSGQWGGSTISYKGRQDANSYAAGNLEFGTTYYWRIDEVNNARLWKGDIWQFTTRSGLAANPVPADKALYVDPNTELTWRPGEAAADINGHKVYFSANYFEVLWRSAEFITVSSASFSPGMLNYNTTYYWAVDEVNDINVWAGDIWYFKTNTEGALPVLTNAPMPLEIPTYDGSGQAMHPDVAYFPEKWNGYDYWMTMTPYTKMIDQTENPCIVVSNNGIDWQVPPGLTNPLILPPDNGYNADPELVYNDDTNELWVYFLRYWKSTSEVKLTLMKSSDGVNWTEPEYLLTWSILYTDNERSFSIIKQGSDWHYWGQSNDTPQKIYYRYSTDGKNWSDRTPVYFSPSVSSLSPWHLNVIYVPARSEYWMLFTGPGGAMGTGLYFAKSTDRMHWTLYNNEVLVPSGAGWDNGRIYRCTMLYDSDRGVIRLWYSASDAINNWATGYTETKY